MKYTLTLLCSLLCLPLFGCAPPMTPQQQAAQEESANRLVVCRAGNDCQEKWSRAIQWVINNSEFKIQTQSDNLIQTFGPDDDAFWAYVITKVAQGHNKYLIDFRPACGNPFGCLGSEASLRAGFADYVMGPDLRHKHGKQPVPAKVWMSKVSKGMKAATEECRTQYNTTHETHVAYVQCTNPRIKDLYKRSGCPYNDLIQLLLDKNLEYAQMVDDNKITEQESTSKVSDMMTYIQEESDKRNIQNY